MLITQLPGKQLAGGEMGRVDYLPLEWYECNKRILHKQTQMGQPVRLKFLKESPRLQQGDILFEDESLLIAVEIIPCEVIVLTPTSILDAAAICYEIGNKHLPLFYEANELLVPYEAPLHRLMKASGYAVKVEKRKLLSTINTSVLPHMHSGSGSLFSRIVQLTNS
ncbi:urease accessory protein UreE [Segetibacter sp. 3557_3]|uniref:urease accessory protein UreE n=1 Tax=Segetibacter sp. 3557_3 TaxID=2547429 RepID=UPI0010587970|nr:urease accessory protein UreE [Segetibacter sp. 3557_3]TDH24188.1 urease accessory protein UreE [Segetibacter sp. 3557_3]